MALPAEATTMRASTYPNVANEGARAYEKRNRVIDTGTHAAAMDAELKTVTDDDGNDVFPNGNLHSEAEVTEIFEERPQFLDEFHTIVNRYYIDS